MRLSTKTFAATIAALTLAAGTAGAAELRFAHTNSPQSYANMAAEKFAEEVAEKTGGDLTIGLFPAGQLGGGGDLIKGNRLGTIDITMNGNPWYTGFNPVQNVLDLPFIFEDHDHVYRALDGEVGEKIAASLEEHGLKLLAFWEIGFRNVINSARPVETPADLEGLKIRTTGNKAHIEAFSLLGANPQPMPFGEVYLALQTNVIDGTEHPVNEVYEMNFQEVTDNLSLTRHAYTAMVVTMNLRRWQSLGEEEQAIIMEAAENATAFQRELLAEENVKRLQLLKDAGMAVVEDVDRDAFRDVVYDTVKQSYEAEFGDELTTAIESAR